MKIITAFLHHVRVTPVVDALSDAGYRNLTLQDVKGTLKPVNESERAYSSEARLVISEVKLSLVCEDTEAIRIVDIIRTTGKIGTEISGWVYINSIEQAIPIGGN